MDLANKTIKQAYFGGNQADLSKEISASDVKSVSQVLGRELAKYKKVMNAMMARKAQVASL